MTRVSAHIDTLNDVIVGHHPENLGTSGAIRTGFTHALGHDFGCSRSSAASWIEFLRLRRDLCARAYRPAPAADRFPAWHL